MSRTTTIPVPLTPRQLKLVRDRVHSGEYPSEADVIRASLKTLLGRNGTAKSKTRRTAQSQLAAAYRASAREDRRLAAEWAALDDSWPSK